jgi:hypothetical protein
MPERSFTEAEARAVYGFGEIVQGKDGWLFLDSEHEQAIAQQTGELLLSDQALDAWRILLETRTAWLERLGTQYLFVIAPDAAAVYPEKLPEGARPAHVRPVLQVLDHLARSGSFARLVYPLDELLEEKRRRWVYSQTDSHWNFLGAFIAYRRILAELDPSIPRHEVLEDQLRFQQVEMTGDLGYKVEPNRSSPFVAVTSMAKTARLVEDNCVLNDGSLVWLERDAPPSTCLFLGDSNCVNLLLFMAETFGKLVYGHVDRLDFDLVARHRPDVVVSMIGERYLRSVPYDLPQHRVLEIARERQARGELRKPLAWWR